MTFDDMPYVCTDWSTTPWSFAAAAAVHFSDLVQILLSGWSVQYLLCGWSWQLFRSDCLFSFNLSVYVLKAGNKHHLHWCVLDLDVLQRVSITLSMRTRVCTDTRKLQYVFDCQCCTAYQHMQTGKARASSTCNSCLVSWTWTCWVELCNVHKVSNFMHN